MPQETLTFPPLYCIVGAYRLVHDATLWKPMWAKCSKAAKQAGLFGLGWAVLTWPLQRLFVYYFMSASASLTGVKGMYETVISTADRVDDPLPFVIPVPSWTTFATFMFVLNQVHTIMEFWLRRRLRECRNTAYASTVRSRGKAPDWWTEYVEEFENPPTQKAIKDAKKQGFYMKLASPVIRIFVLKVLLLPVDFVPFFGTALGAALRSLSFGRLLHKPFFEAKRMTPFQVELWITERQSHYRSFGFAAALMERIPLIGLVFSISNRIGAAMWAHDLEKRQQLIRSAGPGAKITFKEKPTIKKLVKEANAEAPSRTEQFTGEGLAVLRSHTTRDGSRAAVFTHMSFTFPLKLISPRASSRIATGFVAETASRKRQQEPLAEPKAVTVLYIVGYGGGLVSGDSVDLDVDVGQHCTLLLLTQGSTKVFKIRQKQMDTRISDHSSSSQSQVQPDHGVSGGQKLFTRQVFRFLLRPNSTLVLLPDPVTCFAASRYDQVQRFDVRDRKTCSLVLLDWITPGRTAVRLHGDKQAASDRGPRRPEVWSFESYRSRNEVRIDGQVVARDVLLLEQDPELDMRIVSEDGAIDTELARRNSPYGCYATLILSGPEVRSTIRSLANEFESIQQRVSTQTLPPLLWSLSFLEREQQGPNTDQSSRKAQDTEDPGCVIVRIGGRDAEAVRDWLRDRLQGLRDVVGSDLYRQALGS